MLRISGTVKKITFSNMSDITMEIEADWFLIRVEDRRNCETRFTTNYDIKKINTREITDKKYDIEQALANAKKERHMWPTIICHWKETWRKKREVTKVMAVKMRGSISRKQDIYRVQYLARKAGKIHRNDIC